MPTSGHLRSVENSFFALAPPHECQETPTPPNKSQINPASKLRQSWEWLRTLHEVLHEVHTTKICIHHCNDESLD